MAECKHELKYLVGIADGIRCRNCGEVFKDYDALYAAKLAFVQKSTEKAEPKKPAPKKGGKTSARKQ